MNEAKQTFRVNKCASSTYSRCLSFHILVFRVAYDFHQRTWYRSFVHKTMADSPHPAWLPPAEGTTHQFGTIEDGMKYGQRLFHYTYATGHDNVHYLQYRMLHRVNIFHLQNRLARLKATCWTNRDVSDTDLLDLKTTLHDYSEHLYFPLLSSLQLNRSFYVCAKAKNEHQIDS